MQKLKRIICLLIAVSMVTSLLGISVFAAEKVKLSKSSVTMLEGGTTVLKVTGTDQAVSWSTSDKTVCTVSKSGKVTAKSEGTAKICAKVGNEKLYCKVKVVKSHINAVSNQSLEKNETVLLYIKAYNVKKAKAVSGDTSIVKVSSPTISDGRIVLKLTGVGTGTAKVKLYDALNKKTAVQFTVTVQRKGSSSEKISESDDFAGEMVKLINKTRKKEGDNAVKLDETLCKAAQIRAEELAENNSIFRPDGTLGVSVLKEVGLPFTGYAELTAQDYYNCSDAFDYWTKPGNGNVLGYKKVGVGYDEKSGSWVLIFTD